MTQDDALVLPPRPGDARTWEAYVDRLRTLRLWAGAQDDELAGAVPELSVEAIGGVLGERRAATPDRRATDQIVRACLLLRDCSEEEIARERALWRAAWDRVLAGDGVRPSSGRARRVAGGVLLPAVTGVVGNLATSNMANPWTWGALGLVVAAHAALLLAGPSRWFGGPLPVVVAVLAAAAVIAALLLAPRSRPEIACAPGDPASYVTPPVRDPGLGITWQTGHVCPNRPATVYSAAGRVTGRLLTRVSLFLCWVETRDGHWYRTVADEAVADRGWGYVSEQHVHATHPVPGMDACP
ncbi:hypothetical protein [Nonomuraea sp. NPDC050643]|uniref:hypothetical protein n=1 Tax=Nonomuraea sp. NPDC050643 TaxID=3155660 RepID=UPI003402EEC4